MRRLRQKGAKKAIESPDYLWMLACQYFNSIDENPFLKQELTKFGQPVEIQNLKPYTWAGLEDFLLEKELFQLYRIIRVIKMVVMIHLLKSYVRLTT